MPRFSRKTRDRALVYIRCLEALIRDQRHLVSSRDLAALTGFTAEQIRKDISHFGRVGTPRLGYPTSELKTLLENYLLQKDVVHIALFGVGHLGQAILRYPGFHREKIRLVSAFDKDPRKIGRVVDGVRIYALEDAPRRVRRSHAEIGIIAVPSEESQRVADVMVLAGLRGIVNFSPTTLQVPKEVRVRDIDLSIEFLSLFCEIQDMTG